MMVVFGFARPKSEAILSKVIRWVEKRPFSHAYIRLIDPYSKQDVILQASGLSVNLILLDYFDQEEIRVEEFQVDVDDSKQLDVWNYVLSRLGISYSVLQLFRIGLKKLFGGSYGDNGEQAEICSELAARMCEYLGTPISGDLDYETPSDFEEFCVTHFKRIL